MVLRVCSGLFGGMGFAVMRTWFGCGRWTLVLVLVFGLVLWCLFGV